MLESLYIENFAIIDHLQIDFQAGMTVITGETGAGKSIIIDAIGQLAGERTSLGYIKKGREKAFIEGIFSVDEQISHLLEEYNIPLDDRLVVSKTLQLDGKTIIKMNYKNVTQIVLKKIVPFLVDIHSQFETHQLFNPKNHIHILDSFIGSPLDHLKKEYVDYYHRYTSLKKEYHSLIDEELSDEQLDFYKAQLDEINEIDFDHFNEDELVKERKNLLDFEKNNQHFQEFEKFVNGSQGALSLLESGLSQLSYIEDEEIKKIYDQLYDLYYSLNDCIQEVSSISSSHYFDEDYFQELQDQYFTFNKLKRKYGQTIDSILEFKDNLCKKIDHFNHRDELLLQLEKDINLYYDKACELSNQMTQLRQNKAIELQNNIMNVLKQLYLPNIQLEFTFTETELSSEGKDSVVINVSTNVGQNLKPLQKIASGGELSRIMLAIKTVCQQFNGISTIIFDEADTGVSGKVAESIGQVMKNIAKKQQVICITHLAQVASFAAHHLLIEKNSSNLDTTVSIKELNEQESIVEIAKMISGADVSKESLQHASILKKNNA